MNNCNILDLNLKITKFQDFNLKEFNKFVLFFNYCEIQNLC